MNVTCLVFTQKKCTVVPQSNFNFVQLFGRTQPLQLCDVFFARWSNNKNTGFTLFSFQRQTNTLLAKIFRLTNFSTLSNFFRYYQFIFCSFPRACRMKWADHAHIRLSGGELPALHGGHSFGSLRNRRWTSPRNAIPNAVFGWELSEPAGHVRSQFADGTHIARRIRSAKCLEFAIICSTSSAVPSVGCAKP